MNMKLTAPYLGSTDVEPHNDFATETVGVDRQTGLWVITAAGDEVRFSLEVQNQIHEALGSYLESAS